MAVPPVIIIGAGLVGLVLGNALKKAGIPFEIYERDSNVSARGQGWAVTLHFALDYLRKMLDPVLMEAIDSVQVDPEVGRHDTGNFLFLNLSNCEVKYRIPPNERRRVNREKLRKVLLEPVAENVQWSKRLVTIEADGDHGHVMAIFEDGTQASGSIIVGAEGSNSATRKFLRPDGYKNEQLPIRFVGSGIDMTPTQVQPLRDLDPLLFQGCHPTTSCFMWFSMLETPEVNGTKGSEKERYRVQINLSWPVKSEDDEVKPTYRERVADMKRRAAVFAPRLKAAVDAINDDEPALEIKLADWPCYPWDNHNGRVTLVGDAAHAMTMYRGEAGNQGIVDAFKIFVALQALYKGEKSQTAAIDDFEAEMRSRTSAAALLSRQACFDAHDWSRLTENSAVLTKRAITTK